MLCSARTYQSVLIIIFIFTEDLVTPTDVMAYVSSDRAKEAQESLNRIIKDNEELSANSYIGIRNFLIVAIVLRNAPRPGIAFLNL